MTEYSGTPLCTRILGRHYDLLSWDAIMTSYAGRPYDRVSWDVVMNSYPGTPL